MHASFVSTPPEFVSSSEASVLDEILDGETALAIWERPAVVGLLPSVNALMQNEEPIALDILTGGSNSFLEGLRIHLNDAPEEVAESFSALAADAEKLAAKFSEITGRAHLRLRLERVEDDGCALFHVDTLPMRMLCTYAGPGTQWLEENNVRRDQLGSRGRTLDEANRAIVLDLDKIHTAPAWHVLVFKGRSWEGHGYSDGLVHRSAPLRHPEEHRLRLTIDFSDACNC